MDRNEIIGRLMPVMHDTFDNDDIVYRDDLSAKDVEEWDSLSNIRFMVSVEKAFKIRFSSVQWEGLKQLSDLVDLIASK